MGSSDTYNLSSITPYTPIPMHIWLTLIRFKKLIIIIIFKRTWNWEGNGLEELEGGSGGWVLSNLFVHG